MFIRLPSLIVSLTAVASSVIAPAAVADEIDMGLQAIDASRFVEQLRRDRPFLQQITNPRFYPADQLRNLRACRDLPHGTDCALMSKSNGNDGVPTVPPKRSPDLPENMDNMLVTFAHDETFVFPQSGNAFSPPYRDQVSYFIDSSISDLEAPIMSATVGGDPSVTEGVVTKVWRALILNGCNNPPAAIPIGFEAVISFAPDNPGVWIYETVASYDAIDNTTLNGTGFWNYQFAVDAYHSDGSTGVIDVRGTVSVTCTAAQSL